MELKERKKIKNRLPGFADGLNNNSGQPRPNTYANNTSTVLDRFQAAYGNESVPNNPEFQQSVRDAQGKVNANMNNTKMPSYLQDKGGVAGNGSSSAAGAGMWFALGEWLGSGVASGLKTIKRDTSDVWADAGKSFGNAGGFQYERQNTVDVANEMSNYDKDTAMSFLTNPGKGLTQLFGRNKHKNTLKLANQRAETLNNYSRSGALSDYMQQEYANRYGDNSDQLLYGAKEGKDAYTSFGKQYTKPNARVAGGESIVNLDNVDDATGTLVRNGKYGVDGPKANLGDTDIVLGTQKDWRNGISFMAQAAPYTEALEAINNKYEKRTNSAVNRLRGSIGRQTDELQQQVVNKYKQPIVAKLKDLADQQKYQHQVEGYINTIRAKNGKDCLPKFASGGNWWIDGLGVAAGLEQMFHAALNKPKKPSSYVLNPYENAALTKLAGLRINPYPIMDQLSQQERRNIYAINRAGGLSGAQKHFANVATGIGTQNALVQAIQSMQQQNNMYKSNYASTLLNAGQANRQAMMSANQFDLDYYSKAHAARQQMFEQGMYNALAAAQQGYANQFKKQQFDDTMDLYRQQVDSDAYNAKRNRRIYIV